MAFYYFPSCKVTAQFRDARDLERMLNNERSAREKQEQNHNKNRKKK